MQRLLRAGKNRDAGSAEFDRVEGVASRLFDLDISRHGRDRDYPYVRSAQGHDEGDGIVGGYVGIDKEGTRHPRSIANHAIIHPVTVFWRYTISLVMPTLAAVDIGSNSVRLKISRLSGRRLIEIHEDRQVTRLGDSVFRTGFLSPEAIDDTVKALRRFHRAVQHEGADTVRVVATSALRDARNSRAFLEWVRSATGWKVEIISGLEEARLIHLGLVSSLRVSAATTLMVDLGGGSCELTISSKGHIRDTVSLPLGAVRLTNEFLHARSAPQGGAAAPARICGKRNWAHCRPHRPVPAKNRDRDLGHGSFPGRGLSWLVQDERCARHRGLARPDATALPRCWRACPSASARNFPESGRGALKSWSRARWSMPNFWNAASCRVSATLRWDCATDCWRRWPRNTIAAPAPASTSNRSAGTRSAPPSPTTAWTWTMRCKSGNSPCTCSRALKSLHRLPPEYAEWLSAAAMLYEVGDYVNRNGRHRHAYYIIAHSEILGYTPEQRRIIAATARYLGKSRPAPGDTFMKILPPADREFVRKASLLLRLARALNLGRSGAVRGARVRVGRGEVKLTLQAKPRASVDLELWAVEKEKAYFREVFGRELSAAAA